MIKEIDDITFIPKRQARERVSPIESSAGLESMVAEITALQLEFTAKEAGCEQATALAERELANRLRPVHLQMEALAKRIKTRLARVQVFVETNRETLLPGDKKSFELPTAIVGFAISTKAKVAMANEGDNWESVALRLEGLSWGEAFVRYPDPEVDKDALIKERDNITAKQLEAAGIRIDQPEKFYVQPKSQVAETVK